MLAAALLPACLLAQEQPDPAKALLRDLKDADQVTIRELVDVLPLMARPELKKEIRHELLHRDRFPAAPLVETLGHPDLVVRIAAIELLEERAGGDFEFNPWLPPKDPESQGSLERWRKWAEKAPAEDPDEDKGPLLDEEQRRGYLRDLLSNDSDKAARARAMLQTDGMASVGFLQEFLKDSPNLPPGKWAKVRQAQYQIVLARAFGAQAPMLARHLAFGTRDQMLAAIGQLRSSGLAALPILRDFITHADPLVRESAIDSMLGSGGAQALPVVAPVLAKETDVNVIHGALRRLKDVPGDESIKLASGFLDRKDEDLLVSAVQTCLTLMGGGQDIGYGFDGMPMQGGSSKGDNKETDKAVLALLESPNWRVRSAALEYVAGRRLSEAKEKVVAMLEDPDEFVRFQALKTAAAIRARDALPKLKEMFLSDVDMVGPVLDAYARFGTSPDADELKALEKFPPEARLSVISAARSQRALNDTVLRFTDDENLDVACAALRQLSGNDDELKKPEVATAVIKALRSDSTEKRQAVLLQLDLPQVEAVDPALASLLEEEGGEGKETALDGLYDAFLDVDAGDGGRQMDAMPGAVGKLVDEVVKIAKGESEDAFRAALVLARAGHADGHKVLIGMLPELNTAHKAAIAEKLYNPKQREALDLLRLLIREPVEEIRKAAAQAAQSNRESPAFQLMVLEELIREGSVLRAHEIDIDRMSSAAAMPGLASKLRTWVRKVMEDDKAEPERKVLATLLIGRGDIELLEKAAKGSPDRWVRRAAYYAIGRKSFSSFRDLVPELMKDSSPQVRAVLPEVTVRTSRSSWEHRFNDLDSARDRSYDSNRSRRVIGSVCKEALHQMARADPSATNRFEAGLALLTHGEEVDMDAFARLLSQQSRESYASYRVADWMGDNMQRLGQGFLPVLSAIDTNQVRGQRLQQLATMLGGDGSRDAGFASFEALVATDKKARSGDAKLLTDVEPQEAVERDQLVMIYFFKPGCRDCAKVSDMIDSMREEFPLLEVKEYNILDSEGTLLNQALCDRFLVPSREQNVAPSLFVQGGFLVTDQIVPAALGDLLADTMRLKQNDNWMKIGEEEIELAAEEVEKRYDSLTLPIVIGAGLLDGINPCAFATIIFFLSYLQIARRTPREMLMVGAAFILAVFLAYLAAGIALHKVLALLTEQLQGLQKWLNVGFGLLALVAAGLSFRDAVLARQGKAEEMTLQLPGFLKERIRGVIRSKARARRFVIAAFVAGILISLLELACTGQVYAPIIYQIQKGEADAYAMLVLYNLAFILPLVVIFIAVWAGMSSEALVRFQKKSTFAVKLLLGLLFLLLALIMFFGDRILPYA